MALFESYTQSVVLGYECDFYHKIMYVFLYFFQLKMIFITKKCQIRH
ncbi:hypothetical protein XBKQ1_350022 [Xenorhabdus bovienii str. kraussei Quebec]|uniref:Uncharacterized protein n=3 Tax=Xenorhabdus bovienii TaxID=40576 RepID=A0A077PKX5_XENBV|nr:hypothetical protein XBO1_1960014 [Xenorhabdus bovienii str. oregonense]CDH21331.1 hypothetical protein XBKQ1_350022 [Xenorhabdus bovienii str. kraussei Quebec]CDH32801.1 hypothetical protein XBI1_2260022 [Xenorhabdus bovienii str. Intermedium]